MEKCKSVRLEKSKIFFCLFRTFSPNRNNHHNGQKIVYLCSNYNCRALSTLPSIFFQKGCFKKLHLQLTISFFPENVSSFNDCGHKYNVVSIKGGYRGGGAWDFKAKNVFNLIKKCSEFNHSYEPLIQVIWRNYDIY